VQSVDIDPPIGICTDHIRKSSFTDAQRASLTSSSPPILPTHPYTHNLAILAIFDAVPQGGQIPDPSPTNLAI